MFSFFGQQKGNVLVCNADSLPGFYAAMAIHETGHFQEVICTVCDREDEFSRKLESAGLQLREWNTDDKNSVERAIRGVQCCVLIPRPHERIRQRTQNILEAFKAVEVRRLVYWSLLGVEQAEEQRFRRLHELREIEEMVRRCNINATVVRIGFAQQKLFLLSHMIQDRGVLPLPTGRGKFAPVNLRDCGVATARLVSSSEDLHHQKHQTYKFTGPNLMTGRKLVEHANRVLQAEIEYEDIDIEEFKKILKETRELNEWQLELLIEECELIKQQKLAIRSEDLHRILGKEPTDIETFFKNNADSFRPSGGRIRRLALRELQF